MNQLNEEVRSLNVMLGFYRRQLTSCEPKYEKYIKEKITVIENEITDRLEAMNG